MRFHAMSACLCWLLCISAPPSSAQENPKDHALKFMHSIYWAARGFITTGQAATSTNDALWIGRSAKCGADFLPDDPPMAPPAVAMTFSCLDTDDDPVFTNEVTIRFVPEPEAEVAALSHLGPLEVMQALNRTCTEPRGQDAGAVPGLTMLCGSGQARQRVNIEFAPSHVSTDITQPTLLTVRIDIP